jgi:hypothetical protein
MTLLGVTLLAARVPQRMAMRSLAASLAPQLHAWWRVASCPALRLRPAAPLPSSLAANPSESTIGVMVAEP